MVALTATALKVALSVPLARNVGLIWIVSDAVPFTSRPSPSRTSTSPESVPDPAVLIVSVTSLMCRIQLNGSGALVFVQPPPTSALMMSGLFSPPDRPFSEPPKVSIMIPVVPSGTPGVVILIPIWSSRPLLKAPETSAPVPVGRNGASNLPENVNSDGGPSA